MLGIEPECLRVECFFGVEIGGRGRPPHIRFGKLLEVHHRVRAVDASQRERVDQFLTAHLLTIVFRRPAQEAQKVDKGLGQEPGIAVRSDAHDRPVTALGEFRSVRCDQKWEVRKLRRRETGSFKDQHMLESVGEMVLAANDMTDAQVGVIRARGQVIGRHAVGP